MHSFPPSSCAWVGHLLLKFFVYAARGTLTLQTYRRVRHPHYVICDAVGFLFVPVTWFID
jgi:hypothetical protein